MIFRPSGAVGRVAFVPEGTQNVSVATAIGMKATNGLVHSFRLSPD
jgi:hypothetical protein